MELVAEIIVQFLLIFPGAFIRWMCCGFQGTYAQQLVKSEGSNIMISVLFIGAVVTLLKLIK